MARPFVAFLAIFLLAACSVSSQPRPTESPVTAIDTYNRILHDEVPLQAAEQHFIAKCMEKKGLKYVPSTLSVDQSLTEALPESVAASVGYPQLVPTPLSSTEK